MVVNFLSAHLLAELIGEDVQYPPSSRSLPYPIVDFRISCGPIGVEMIFRISLLNS